MRYVYYEYKKGNVSLSFKFDANGDFVKDKADFIDILKEATKELEENK